MLWRGACEEESRACEEESTCEEESRACEEESRHVMKQKQKGKQTKSMKAIQNNNKGLLVAQTGA